MQFKDFNGSLDARSAPIIELTHGQTFTQEISPAQSGLNGINVWLTAASEDLSRVSVSLAPVDNPDVILASSQNSITQTSSTTLVRLSIPPQQQSDQRNFLLILTIEQGAVTVSGSELAHNSALKAALDGSPFTGNLAYELQYEYSWKTVWEDVISGLPDALNLFPLLIGMLMPGFLLQRLLFPHPETDLIYRFGTVLGLSLAFWPLIFLWSTLLGVHWSTWVVIVLMLVSGAITLSLYVIRRPYKPQVEEENTALIPETIPHYKTAHGLTIIFILLFLVVLQVRFIMIRDLSAPAWVDSVHHGLITRLILETGSLPADYSPYIPGSISGYHSGYHILQAIVQWLSKMPLQQGMLVFGQILNALSIVSVYVLARGITGDRLSGLLAALLAGLFSPMPAYYASWGRYPHLVAVLLLPIAYVQVRNAIKADKIPITRYLGAGILAGGLFLIHYQGVVFFSLLLVAQLIVDAFGIFAAHERRQYAFSWGRQALRLVGIATVSLIIVSPWLAAVLPEQIAPKVISWSTTRKELFDGFTWAFLTTALGKYVNALAGIGLVWSMVRRKQFGSLLAFWIVLMFLSANLAVYGLPGSGFINNLQVEITLFLPLAVLGGYFLSQFITAWQKVIPAKFHTIWITILLALGALGGIYAARQLVTILNPVTFLYRQADQAAIDWIETNIPQDETIVITPTYWGYGLYAGYDGGYWISPLTLRRTIPPPVLYGLSNDLGPVYEVNETVQHIIQEAAHPSEIAAIMRSNGYQYLFIGARGGIFSPELFLDSKDFLVRYANQGVWVFELTS